MRSLLHVTEFDYYVRNINKGVRYINKREFKYNQYSNSLSQVVNKVDFIYNYSCYRYKY